MRPTKFRFWSKLRKTWDRSGQIFSEDGYCGNPDLIPVEFTGLLDKNGKEIYEGDILKWRDEPLRVGWGGVGWVLFSEMFSSFGRPKGSNCNEVNTKGYTNNSEVIGDIYTTPELLTNN